MQGYLDEQFIQLEELQDDDNPDFVEETVTTFYNNSARFLQNIEHTLYVVIVVVVVVLFPVWINIYCSIQIQG